MNKTFVELWEKHKHELREELKTVNRSTEYKHLVILLIENVINKGIQQFDTEHINIIDDGDYQGSQIFLIPEKTYQPSANEYLVTWHYYGSCGGCDALEGILDDMSFRNKPYLDDLMSLCLHLLQKLKYLYESEEM